MPHTYIVTSEPSAEPLAVSTLKHRMRITSSEFDAELGEILSASRRMVEAQTCRALVTQTMRLELDRFPPERFIQLRRPPVASIASVTYRDQDEAVTTLPAAAYNLDLNSAPARLVLESDSTWPVTAPRFPAAVLITFIAGQSVSEQNPIAILAVVEQCKLRFNILQPERVAPDNWPQTIEKRYRQLIGHLQWTGVVPPA